MALTLALLIGCGRDDVKGKFDRPERRHDKLEASRKPDQPQAVVAGESFDVDFGEATVLDGFWRVVDEQRFGKTPKVSKHEENFLLIKGNHFVEISASRDGILNAQTFKYSRTLVDPKRSPPTVDRLGYEDDIAKRLGVFSLDAPNLKIQWGPDGGQRPDDVDNLLANHVLTRYEKSDKDYAEHLKRLRRQLRNRTHPANEIRDDRIVGQREAKESKKYAAANRSPTDDDRPFVIAKVELPDRERRVVTAGYVAFDKQNRWIGGDPRIDVLPGRQSVVNYQSRTRLNSVMLWNKELGLHAKHFGLPSGDYLFFVRTGNYLVWQTRSVDEDSDYQLEFTLNPASKGDLQVTNSDPGKTTKVSIIPLDTGDRMPIGSDDNLPTTLFRRYEKDGEGTALYPGLAPGRYRVFRRWFSPRKTVVQNVEVKAGQVTIVNFE